MLILHKKIEYNILNYLGFFRRLGFNVSAMSAERPAGRADSTGHTRGAFPLFRLTSLALAALIFAGCATCERHPIACGVVGVVVIGGAVAALDHHGHHSEPPNRTSPCAPLPITECAQ